MATALGQLSRGLSVTNPWWRSTAWRKSDPDLTRADGSALSYESPCLDGIRPGGLYLLRGPRRVGKTVASKQAIDRLLTQGTPPACVVRVAADGWAAKDLRTVVQNASLPPIPEGHHRWWFIDEVTAVTGDWSTQVKYLRDNDAEFNAAAVILTGSSSEQLTAASGVLAGRRGNISDGDRTLLPMGFATFARLFDSTIPPLRLPLGSLHQPTAASTYANLTPWLDSLVRLWEMYLLFGGFPASVVAARRGDGAPPDWFVQDVFNVVFKDAFASSRLSETQTISILERLAVGMASPLNMSSIASALGLTEPTVARHVSYLDDAYLGWHCPQRAEGSWTPRKRAQGKWYSIDPLVARLAHLSNSQRSDVDLTVLAEMQIGVAIRRRALLEGRGWNSDAHLFFARTSTRKEIDFVAEDLAGVAVEGKYTDGGGWVGEAATVNASQWDGILATRTTLDTRAVDTAWAVPAAFIAYLIDS